MILSGDGLSIYINIGIFKLLLVIVFFIIITIGNTYYILQFI